MFTPDYFTTREKVAQASTSMKMSQINMLEKENSELKAKIQELQMKIGAFREAAIASDAAVSEVIDKEASYFDVGSLEETSSQNISSPVRKYGSPQVPSPSAQLIFNKDKTIHELKVSISKAMDNIKELEKENSYKEQELMDLKRKYQDAEKKWQKEIITLKEQSNVREELIDQIIENTNTLREECEALRTDSQMLCYMLRQVSRDNSPEKTIVLSALNRYMKSFISIRNSMGEKGETESASSFQLKNVAQSLNEIASKMEDQTISNLEKEAAKSNISRIENLEDLATKMGYRLSRAEQMAELYKFRKLVDNNLIGELAKSRNKKRRKDPPSLRASNVRLQPCTPITIFKSAVTTLYVAGFLQTIANLESTTRFSKNIQTLLPSNASTSIDKKLLSQYSPPSTTTLHLVELPRIKDKKSMLDRSTLGIFERISVD